MKYHKCNVAGCETRLSEGSPSICPKHSELSEDWSESKIRQFREWAQEYLDGGRWAGFDYFTAIRTELLERDAEVKALHAKVSELERKHSIFERMK